MTKAGISLVIALVLCGAAQAQNASVPSAAIATADQYGTEAAKEILDAGGNAVDAAVAVAFTLAVTYPEAGNLGGGGFATIFMDGKEYFLDYREVAPAAATADMFLDRQGNVMADASVDGARAVGVPGTVAGLWALHQRFGHLPWARDLVPAIRYARVGFAPAPALVKERAERARELGGKTNFGRYFAMRAGENFRQPELEATLERIATNGARGFYTGKTAALLAAEMTRDGGLITTADLAHYVPRWRTPVTEEWAGFHVITAPPPSSGGIMLLSMLAMKADLASQFAGVTLNSAQYVHLVAEIEKRVFADRAEYLGDPDFTSVPVAALLSPAYLSRRASEVSPSRPTPTAAVHPGLAQDPGLLESPAPREHHNTTHFSIVDRAGNAVSNTYTLNNDFGSGVVVAGAGFVLNDEMDNFSVKPGSPNLYGVVGGAANAIAAGKRPLSTMTPTIITQNGHVALVVGTPGGSRIATSVFQVVTDWHDFHMPLRDAVAAVRVHHQLLPPDTIFEEDYGGLSAGVEAELTARGYRFVRSFAGDIQAIACSQSGCEAAADPRARGVALVPTPRAMH